MESQRKADKNGAETVFLKGQNFFTTDLILQIQEVPETSNRVQTKPLLGASLKSCLNVKKKRKTKRKAAEQESHITFQEATISLTADFATETMEARKQWTETFKVLQEITANNAELYSQLIYSSKMKINEFQTSKNWEFSTTKLPKRSSSDRGKLISDGSM